MHVYALATHNEGYLDALRELAILHHFELHLLGWGAPWQGYIWRVSLIVNALHDHIHTVNADDVVCVIDAYDVLLLVDADELLTRYQALTAGTLEVVFAVENPLGERMATIMKRMVFGTCGTHAGTVNAGACIGPARGCHAVFSSMADHIRQTGKVDDQKVLNNLCPDWVGQHRLVRIDVAGDLIFNATCKQPFPGLLLGRCHLGLDAELRNPRTGRIPCILHAPGGLSMDDICIQLKLPIRIARPRWRWLFQNFKTEILMFSMILVGTVVLLVVLVCCIAQRRKPKSISTGPH